MKRLWIPVLALTLALASTLALAACGGGGGGEGGGAGTVKNTGVFSVTVPDGWTAHDVKDVFSETGEIDATTIQIGKGTKSEMDLFTYPYLQVKYYEPTTTVLKDIQDWYENVNELEPLALGAYTWTGFEGDSAGYHWTVLFAGEQGEPQFQVSLSGGTEIDTTASIADEDVQAMIASITPSAQ